MLNKSKSILLGLVFVPIMYFPSLSTAQTALQAKKNIISSMSANPKIISANALLQKYNSKEKISVLVMLNPSVEGSKLAKESLSNKAALDSFQATGASSPDVSTFYDLSNPNIRRELKSAVEEKLNNFSLGSGFSIQSNSAGSKSNALDVKITHKFKYIFGFSAEVTPEGLKQLSEHPDVKSINENRELYPHTTQGIPLMQGSNVRNLYDGAGISIAVTDTGIDTSHPALGGSSSIFNSKVIGGFDFGEGDSDPRPSGDSNGKTPLGDSHGTSVAGIAAGNILVNGDYIGGVAPSAKLYALKISNDMDNGASSQALIDAWEWVIEHQNDDPENPIMVINTSFGGGSFTGQGACDARTPMMTQAAANASAMGISIFASSGNNGFCNSIGWPACISKVNSVGAVYDGDIGNVGWCVSVNSCIIEKRRDLRCTGQNQYITFENTGADKVTAYSNSASFLTLFAPSNNASTPDIVGSGGRSAGDYRTNFGGTSAASPYAAGSAVVLQSAAMALTGNFLTPAELTNTLTSTGDSVTDSKVAISKPRINLQQAVDKITPAGSTAPIALSPSGSINDNTPTFTWIEVPGAVRYAVVARDSNGAYLVNNSTGRIECPNGKCSYSKSNTVFSDGAYSWNVRVLNPDNSNGETSNTINFTVDTGNKPSPETIVDACKKGQTPVGNVELFAEKPVCLQDVSNGGQRQMHFFVTEERVGSTLEIILSHGSGDGILLHKHDGRPRGTTYDHISNNAGNEEKILVRNVQEQWNYIHVQTDSAFSGATLLVRYAQ